MKMLKVFFALSIISCFSSLYGQQTVGLFFNTIDSYNGYTLFAPMGSLTTYLINNCGEKVHSWNSDYKPGLSVYMLKNGNLLRTRNVGNTTFVGGGAGGGIEMLDWSSNVIWDYTISSNTECQHHDVEYLPNGNILAVVWDYKTSQEAIQAGREICGPTLWSEKIVEIHPDLINGGGTVVWEWKAWDHLVQDFDSTKDNFGVVADAPELIDINFNSSNPIYKDWLHINSVDYNQKYDQILLSCHNFGEIWIIDHSTTNAQAASHQGGNSNKGGDLLYRWGNPQTYRHGTSDDQLFFGQHDAYWIDDSLKDAGMIMVFNNQAGSPLKYSEVDVINPPVDDNGYYTYSDSAYLPFDYYWSYKSPVPTDFYAANISGAQRLPNGNTLICSGPSGEFFEVDYQGDMVWKYINPVSKLGIVSQGDTVINNVVFRCYRYPVDYEGFMGEELTPQGYIENGSSFSCTLYPTGINSIADKVSFTVYPNPAKDIITISANKKLRLVCIYNVFGEKIIEQFVNNKQVVINTSQLNEGLYLICSISEDGNKTYNKIIISK